MFMVSCLMLLWILGVLKLGFWCWVCLVNGVCWGGCEVVGCVVGWVIVWGVLVVICLIWFMFFGVIVSIFMFFGMFLLDNIMVLGLKVCFIKVRVLWDVWVVNLWMFMEFFVELF